MIIWLQVYGDPEAADIVFTCGADIIVVGINITTQVQLLGCPLVTVIFNFLPFSCHNS